MVIGQSGVQLTKSDEREAGVRFVNHENGCRIILFCRSQAFLMYVENLDMDNSVKWVPLNIVSGQITSDALWKNSKVRYFY